MNKEFYFIRHGQTDANLQGVMSGGGVDIELNQTGQRQAIEAAKLVKAMVPDLRAICASPLKRARATAEAIAIEFGHSIHIIDELKEWHLGEWEGVPFDSVKHDFLGTGEPIHGESRADFKNRIQRALFLCTERSDPLLIVSHGGVSMVLQDLLGITRLPVKNCIPHRVYRSVSGAWAMESLAR